MSTSDNMPPSSRADHSPADDQQLNRLYNRMNQSSSESSSPTDLDDLIRAAAKTQKQLAKSSYWQWQQRAGWATAAAIVLTSVLFLALPESTPELANSTQNPRSSPEALTTPVALEADIQAEGLEDVSREVEQEPSVAAPAPKPALKRLTPQASTLAGAPYATLPETRQDVSPPPSAPALLARQARSKTARSDLLRTPNCETIAKGPIRRICGVTDSNHSYILQPSTTTLCEALRLDKQALRPTASADSTAEEFVYTVGTRKYSATCKNGEWLIQSLARGRADGAGPTENARSNQTSASPSL